MDWLTLPNFYFVCGLGGGSVLVLQFLLLVMGLDDHDSDLDFAADEAGVGANSFFGHLSLKTIVAFTTFFGLTGMLAGALEVASWMGLTLALGAGLVAFYLVAFLMSCLYRLHSEGNIDLTKAVGKTATVYLRIPAANDGSGKVSVSVQDRTLELQAITYGEEIPTGSSVLIVGQHSDDIFEVTPF